MPSPFPGMDPYLEDPSWFPDLHDCLIQEIKRQLQPQLPAACHAITRRRAWIEEVHDPREPDVAVVQVPVRATPVATTPVPGAPSSSTVMVQVPRATTVETFLEIYILYSGRRRRLITSIEVLSPSNKSPRSPGRKKFRRKQAEMLAGRVNVLEIDLLRSGRHTTAIPFSRLQSDVPPCPWHVCTRRATLPDAFFVDPCPLRSPLPKIAVPLRRADTDATLNLQAAFEAAYQAGDYGKVVDYTADAPPPRFSPADLAWLQSCTAVHRRDEAP